MKFSDGAWLIPPGVTPAPAKRVLEHRVEGQTLALAVTDRPVGNRVDGTVLQVRVSSPMADVIRVQARHHWPADEPAAGFDLDYSLACKDVSIEQHQGSLHLTAGRLSVRIHKDPWSIHFVDTADGNARVAEGLLGSLASMEVAGRGNFMTQRLTMGVGETIYGLGERFGPLVKNGQFVLSRNEDGGTMSDQAYKAVPFYLSSRGYGLLVNSPASVEFEIATERVSQVQFAVPGEALDYYIFYGPDLKSVLEKYTRLSGRPAIPPAWSFGLWLSTSFTTTYNEQTVTEFVEGMAGRGIPLSVFHFDCFWMKERHWCNFLWDTDAFPDPPAMLKRLHERGLKVCVWINPYISQLSEIFPEGRDKGYFLKTKAGSVYQKTQWQPGMAFVDFTNPAAVKWYQGKLQKLLDMGVDSFKTDFGERIPDDAVYHDGSDPTLMHNYYSYIYNKAVFELLEKHHGKGGALVFARSGTTGSQKFPLHWGGDCEATFESMAEDLRGGLSFCMSGAAFWSHDIGGFEGVANPSLYKRWVAFGLLSSHSRLHGSGSYRVPWLFDEESVEVMRLFAKLKNRLFPYLFSAAQDANAFGWPVMRAMVLEFPNDPTCRYLEHQYMLGESLLVAPVFRQDDVAEYYLPAGQWTHLLSNEVVTGGKWFSEKVDYMTIPVFVRANTLLTMSSDEQAPNWKVADELTLGLYGLADGANLSAHVTGVDGAADFTCTRSGQTITLGGKGARRLRVFVPFGHVKSLSNGKSIESGRKGNVVEWIEAGKPLSLVIDD